MDIILLGRVAEKGTVEACMTWNSRVRARFTADFLKRGISGCETGFADTEAAAYLTEHSAYAYRLNGEGICQALWNFAEGLNCGLRVNINKIAIRGFCIAAADLLDENPYYWDSTGCIIAAAEDAGPLLEELAERGAEAAVIGYTTSDRKRCLVRDGVLSYLTRPDLIIKEC